MAVIVNRRTFSLAAAICGLVRPALAAATARWQMLPPTPPPVAGAEAGVAHVNGIDLYHAQIGSGSPVLMLHGGLANSNYFGHQVPALARRHRVILVDSRGHGRSTRDARPYSYDLMTDDVIALLDLLRVPRAAVIGWSDGAIIGLDMAMRYKDRLARLFAFGANTSPSGLKPHFDKNPTFAAFMARARREYAQLSTTPTQYDAFLSQIGHMWDSQPNWTSRQLRTIEAPVLIADGQHDEGIRLEHTEYMASTIPGAGLLILPSASHFAFLQDPQLFNTALEDFLADY